MSGVILLIDFEKAFDSVRWSFIRKTLKAFRFGNDLVHWVDILYRNSPSAVINNGYFTSLFNLERGVRQGCPLSRKEFIRLLDIVISAAGLSACDTGVITPHSLRRSFATSCSKGNVPGHLIKHLGNWKSDCYQIYIDTPKSAIAHTQQTLAALD